MFSSSFYFETRKEGLKSILKVESKNMCFVQHGDMNVPPVCQHQTCYGYVCHTLPHYNNNYRSSISLLFLLGLRTSFIDDKFCDNGTWTVKLAGAVNDFL